VVVGAAWRRQREDQPFDARLSYELASSGSGTRLTNTAELDPPLPLSIVGNLVDGRIKASVAENLGVLETLLEGGSR
jgi:hypothetical protein